MGLENYLRRDRYRSPMNLIDLGDSQDVDGTSQSARSTQLDCQTVRIIAISGDLRFKVGDHTVVADSGSTFLGDHDKEFVPIISGQYIAVLGGEANITQCGSILDKIV